MAARGLTEPPPSPHGCCTTPKSIKAPPGRAVGLRAEQGGCSPRVTHSLGGHPNSRRAQRRDSRLPPVARPRHRVPPRAPRPGSHRTHRPSRLGPTGNRWCGAARDGQGPAGGSGRESSRCREPRPARLQREARPRLPRAPGGPRRPPLPLT